MANLPSCRLKESVSFIHCGRAMFEPIVVKKRNEVKCYGANICLLAWQVEPSILKWSCFQQPGYRLIYSCIKKTCFQTWKCIRSIYSNNGSNFIGAERELKKAYSEMNDNKHKIHQSFIPRGYRWRLDKMVQKPSICKPHGWSLRDANSFSMCNSWVYVPAIITS